MEKSPLSPSSRRLYTDCFRAPAGGVFDCAIGTTFTLDFEAFLYVPVAISGAASTDPAAALREPVGLLHGMTQVAQRLTVFCHDGRSNAPGVRLPLVGLLEDCFVPVLPFHRKKQGVFHPKLWLIKFRGEDDDSVLLRAVVLSRNLTLARSWDTLIVLEGTPFPKRTVSESKGLANLVRSLPGLAVGDKLSASRREQLEELATLAERTAFWAPAPFAEGSIVRFWALGLKDRQKWQPQAGERVLAISPFISDDALSSLATLGSERQLISRPEALDALRPKTRETWECRWLDDVAGADAELSDDNALDSTADSLPLGLHAKALVVESGKDTTWWLGSANMTDAVMSGANVELMVSLEGPTKYVGIDAFLNGGLDRLLRLHEGNAEEATTDPSAEARRLADDMREALVSAPIEGHCSEEPGGLWSMRLHGDVVLVDGVTVDVWPLSLSDERAHRWTNGVHLSGLSLDNLTTFIAFRVEAEVASVRHRVTFTRKLSIAGMPEDRRRQIIKSVIRNRDDFMSYLNRVLGGVHGDLTTHLLGQQQPLLGGAEARRGRRPALLENLLRAMRRDPARLDAIDRMLRDLSGTHERDDAVIPEEFLCVWELIRKLRGEAFLNEEPASSPPRGERS